MYSVRTGSQFDKAAIMSPVLSLKGIGGVKLGSKTEGSGKSESKR